MVPGVLCASVGSEIEDEERMTEKSDVLVIGGGVIGVCSAYYLAKRGCAVTLVERGEICSGSSYGNSGLVVPSHSVPLAAPGVLSQGLRWLLDPVSPFYIKPRLDLDLVRWLWWFQQASRMEPMRKGVPVLRDLSQASLELYRELADQGELEFGFRQQGWLQIFRSESLLAKALAEARLLREFGLESTLLDTDRVREMEPNVRPSIIAGIHFPDDAHLIPHRFVHEMADGARRAGAVLRTGTEVLEMKTSRTRVTRVVTNRGDFRPEQVVLAAGSWSPRVARTVGLDVPVQPAKGYSVTVKAPANTPRVPLMLADAKVAATPMGNKLRFGGTLELAGLDLSVNLPRVRAILRAAQAHLVGMEELDLHEIWRGLRPLTPDGLPFIGRTRKLNNLLLATGHATIGISLGPITGKLISEVAAQEAVSQDLSRLEPERFQ